MEKKDKELLLKDLCARLPYGVKVTWDGKHSLTVTPYIYCAIISEDNINNLPKLLLRPMSSMTEEEMVEYFYNRMTSWAQNEFGESYTEAVMQYRIDFLLEHHFDYRGLIDKGLALEAPKGMYNNKIEE